MHGADVASSGFTQMLSGEVTSSLTSKGMQAMGMSEKNAELVDAGISVLATAGAASVANASKTGAVLTLLDR